MTTKTHSADLSSKAMLCTLSVSLWTASKHDRKIDDETARNKNMDARMLHTRRALLDPNNPEHKAARDARSALRGVWLRYTLPWLDGGTRILPAKLFSKLAMEIEEKIQHFNGCSHTLADSIDRLKTEAQAVSGDSYNERDYPSDILSKCGVRINYTPMPATKDFRCALTDEQIKRVQQSTEDARSSALSSITRDAFRRVVERTGKIAEKLREPNATFRDSLIRNLREVLDLLPDLNLTEDPELTRMAKEVREKLVCDPEDLRKNKTLRADVAAEAARITEQMAAFA